MSLISGVEDDCIELRWRMHEERLSSPSSSSGAVCSEWFRDRIAIAVVVCSEWFRDCTAIAVVVVVVVLLVVVVFVFGRCFVYFISRFA